MKLTVPDGIKYTIVKTRYGMFQPQREYGDMMLFPAFDTLRDANIFMQHTQSDYELGIVGNVQVVSEVKE